MVKKSPELRKTQEEKIAEIKADWENNPRWEGIIRPYSAADVERLRGYWHIEHSLAVQGALRLFWLLQYKKFVRTFGGYGGPVTQMIYAGLEAIYASGWQVAADANTAGQVYPDQSLYPVDSMPKLVERMNNALLRASQLDYLNGITPENGGTYWFAPIVADAESGFGGKAHVYELVRALIGAGAAGIHLEDQYSSEKKCGHLGGKVLVPVREFIGKLIAARLAADVMGASTIIIARTDANSATYLKDNHDPIDHPFLTGERTEEEGLYKITGGIDMAIARGLAFAPYADLLWCETSTPNLEEAQKFADAIHAKFPGKMLAYNCSPSFNWKKHLDDETIAQFQEKLGDMGYKFQFITLASWHLNHYGTFDLARRYNEEGMKAYVELQEKEFAAHKEHGYSGDKHQTTAGVPYFDTIAQTVSVDSATTAMKGSTEANQF